MRPSTAVRVTAGSSLERAGLERIAASAGLPTQSSGRDLPIDLASGIVAPPGPAPGERAAASVIVNADEVVVRLPHPVDPDTLDDVIALVRAATAPA